MCGVRSQWIFDLICTRVRCISFGGVKILWTNNRGMPLMTIRLPYGKRYGLNLFVYFGFFVVVDENQIFFPGKFALAVYLN